MYLISSQTRPHRPKTLMSFWSSTTKECLCGVAFWFMHSPLRYGPKCKETVDIGSLKERNPKSMPFNRFFGETNQFPVLGNIPSLVVFINIYMFILFVPAFICCDYKGKSTILALGRLYLARENQSITW